jgi:TetR/AcrR family transcriptional regulator, repressor of fatR-cypB operon
MTNKSFSIYFRARETLVTSMNHNDKEPAVLTRKDREKIVRQQEILHAARELFSQKGFHETTLEQVAHYAQFGKGTIYNYFRSKEELLYAIIDQLVEEMMALAQSSTESEAIPAREQFSRFAREVIMHARDNTALLQLIIREIKKLDSPEKNERLLNIKERISTVWRILAKPLEAEIKSGRIKPFDPLTLAMLYDGMLRFYCMNQFGTSSTSKEDDPQDAVNLLVTVFFDGVAQQKNEG